MLIGPIILWPVESDSERFFNITTLPRKCRWRARSDCWRKKENLWRLFLKKGKNVEKFDLWEFRFTNFQQSSCLAKLNQVCTEFDTVVNEACFSYWHLAASKKTQLNFKAFLQSRLPAIWTPHNSTSHCGSCRVNSARLPPQFSPPAFQCSTQVRSEVGLSSRGDKCCYCLFPDLYSRRDGGAEIL